MVRSLPVSFVDPGTNQDLILALPRLYRRSQLVGHNVEFDEFDFLKPPETLRPYMVSPWGHVLEFHGPAPWWARLPKDVGRSSRPNYIYTHSLFTHSPQRRPVHTGTQTNDADITLVDIWFEAIVEKDTDTKEGN
jgi:hypothetical protein